MFMHYCNNMMSYPSGIYFCHLKLIQSCRGHLLLYTRRMINYRKFIYRFIGGFILRRARKKKNVVKKLLVYSFSMLLIFSFVILLMKGNQFYGSQIWKEIIGTTKAPIKTEPSQVEKNTPPIIEEKIEQPEPDNSTIGYIARRDIKTEITISSVGDCTLGHDDKFAFQNSLPYVLGKNDQDFGYFFKNVANIFKADDITTANLETTFTDSTIKADKQFTFKAPAIYAKALPLGGIEGVNISNNHIHDYLDKGFQDTIKALKSENVNYFGEGNQWVTEVKGIKVGFLGYMGFTYDNVSLKKLKDDITKLKEQTQFIVINFHWGVENAYSPNNIQKYLAHYAIDQGADLIIGHHPHVVEGLELYKGKIIAYSLGNFAFGGNMNPSDKNTFILQLQLKFNNSELATYGVRVIPCSISSVNHINDYCPTPLTGTSKETVLKKLNNLSINLGFNLNDEFYFNENK